MNYEGQENLLHVWSKDKGRETGARTETMAVGGVTGDGHAHVQQNEKDITPQLVAQNILDNICSIPWGHIRYILDKKYDAHKSYF